MHESGRFNPRTIDAVEIPDEADDLQNVTRPMSLAFAENARHGTPGTNQSRPIQPDDEFGARQSNVECGKCEIPVADPGFGGVQRLQNRAKPRNISI